MAPAATANEQASRARVKLQGSSSAAAVTSAPGRVAQLHNRRRRAGGSRDRAGWGAADRVGDCGKRADRAVSGGKRAN
eukprot:1508117-Prymnesium_polylepis.1